MRKLFGAAALVISSVLTACGGGGGSAGSSDLPYTISLRADKTQLPLNISNEYASIGAYSPFTTTLYVEAREGGAPILGGEEIFACNMSGGLESGALYYIDGKDEHEVEVDDGKGGKIRVPGAYRNIVLDSNSGGNSFHFHSGDKAGTARIVCTVTNPVDKLVSSAAVDIVVGAATGKPASVIASAQAPGYLGTRDNTALLRNNVDIQAFLMDDANQPIPAPGAANLQVSIRPFGASAGARLLSGTQSGSVLQVRTIGGVGQVSLSSGPDSGVILLEFTTDRSDNNVSNGIQDPVSSLMAVGVFDIIGGSPLNITTTEVADAQEGLTFAYALEASGGIPPYSWSAINIPPGLALSASGVISGAPTKAGSYSVVVTVRDSVGIVAIRNISLNVAEAPAAPTPTPTVPTQAPLAINGCVSDGACLLPDAPAGVQYTIALSVTGGDTTKPVTWIFTPTPPAPWLTGASAGNNGVLNGIPTSPVALTECTVKFLATATRDTVSISRQFSIKVTGGVCP